MAKVTNAIVYEEPIVGNVQSAAEKIISIVKQKGEHRAFGMAFGGETTVNLMGNGKGGRNQELSLRVACEANKMNLTRPWCFLSGGTDGRDGPTDAAGGLVDGQTLTRIQAGSKDIQEVLSANDSYDALHLSNDLLITGATGTNVADLQLFISV
jgi:hydroxypyruvate reductase